MLDNNRLKRILTAPTTTAVIVLSLLWVFFFWRLLTPTQEDRVIFEKGDFPLHYFSYSDYQVERMWEGSIPLWNPYNYGGDPFAANVQWAVWYPPRWIAALIAGPDGWGIEALQLEVAAHYWLISLMMYAYLRVLVKRPFPALVGSVLWTYGGYLTGYPMLQPSILEAIAWLPLLMLGVHLSLAAPRWRIRGILLGSVAIALSFFGGHTQTTLQMGYFAAAYIAVIGWQHGCRWRDILWRVGLLAILGAALSAVQLLPALELTRLSYRAEDYYYNDKSVGFTASEFIQVIWPRLPGVLWWPLYLGVAGFLLAINALARPRKKYIFWFGVIIVGLLLSLGGHSIIYDLFYLIVPGFNIFREQERAASLVMFAMTVLATYQIGWLLNRRTPRLEDRRFLWLARAHLILAAVTFVIVTIAYHVAHEKPDVLPDTLGFIALISLLFNGWLLWQERAARRAISWALVALIVVDLFTFGMKSPNTVPDTPENRIRKPDNLAMLRVPVEDIRWHVDGAGGIQTYGTYWRIPDIYGTGPFSLASTEKLRQIRVDRRWEIFAVRYVTTPGEVPDNVPLEAVGEGVNYDGQEYTLYELTDPRPFAHLVYIAREANTDREARKIMAEPHINLRETGVITGSLPFDLPGERPEDASVMAFKMVMPEYMEMEVSTSAPALLTVAVPNYPGWRATVNGQRTEIVDAYAGLIGVPISPGSNQKVAIQFVPQTVIIGGIISALALFGVISYGIGAAIRARRTG